MSTLTAVHFTFRPLGDEAIGFTVDRRKLIVGSHPTCDVHLDLPGVSSYHLFLCHKGERGVLVKDLCSESGIFVNGIRVEEVTLMPGDRLSFAGLEFELESRSDEVPLFDPDARIPNHASLTGHPSHLVMVDGELCDFTFDESNYQPLTSIPQLAFEGQYEAPEETAEAHDLCEEIKDRRLEVITYINGLIVDLHYVELREGDYFLSPIPQSPKEICFTTLPRTKLLTVRQDKLVFHQNPKLSPSVDWKEISLKTPFFLTHGSEQLSFRMVEKSLRWKSLPPFMRDRDFLKQSSKIFAGLFLPLLLLLFVGMPAPEAPPKEIVVVYKVKKPVEAPTGERSELSAEIVTSATENSGHKEELQSPEKVEFSEASAAETKVAKSAAPAEAKAAPVAMAPAVAKNKPAPVAPSQLKAAPIAENSPVAAAPEAPVVAKAKPAPYKFSSTAVASLVGDAPTIGASTGTQPSALATDKSFNVGSSDTGDLVAGAKIGVGKLGGSDSRGTGEGSYGSRGLASKKGFDSAYLEPNTVVRGSMDPELLRRILREYIPQFRHCYQQELVTRSDKLKGIVELDFTINAQGKATRHQVNTKDARFSEKGVKCMVGVLDLIEFPKPKGGGIVDVKQPLNFLAESGKF